MNITRKLTNLSTLFLSKDKNNTNLIGLDQFIGDFNKRSLIHIYGGMSCGVTSFALDIAYKNPDKTFLYIDTYCNITETPTNCTLFRTGKESQIVSLLKELDPNVCDCIIIDSYSNILGEKEDWNVATYEVMQEALEHIHNLAVRNNCTLILLNTLNSQGKAFNRNNYLKINSICELELINYFYDSDIIEIIPIKSRYINSLVQIRINERND